MAVKLVPKFNKIQINNFIQERKQRIEEAILTRLRFTGEQFVKNARENANFKDRTGNLRSSIGYVVMKDGQQLYENFQTRAGGPEGEEKAKEFMEDVKRDFPTGYVLIGVAGMEYAAAVESKGYDVISNSSTIAAESLKVAIKKLGDKLKQR